MEDREVSKWTIRYYWILTYIANIKRFFKRFTKKGRAELAYEKERLDQIYNMIIHHKSDE